MDSFFSISLQYLRKRKGPEFPVLLHVKNYFASRISSTHC